MPESIPSESTPSAPPAIACNGCGCELGAVTKVQPQTIDNEPWCPRCTAWLRFPKEPARFPSDTKEMACGGCGWTTLSLFGGSRRACGHCGKVGAKPVRLSKSDMAAVDAVAAKLRSSTT